jgi:hypothetical protein
MPSFWTLEDTGWSGISVTPLSVSSSRNWRTLAKMEPVANRLRQDDTPSLIDLSCPAIKYAKYHSQGRKGLSLSFTFT